MAGKTQMRVSWRMLVSIVGAFMLMVAPMSATFCVPNDCASQDSKASTLCKGMDMSKDGFTVHANTSLSCCQMNQTPPAVTIGQNGDTEKVKTAVAILVVPGSVPSGPAASLEIASRDVDSSPPHDLQSLFCTLLI